MTQEPMTPPATNGAALKKNMNSSWKKFGAFARDLVRTRLDKSGGRIRFLMLGLFVAYAGIGAKLVLLGLSHDPPLTLKVAADQAASGAWVSSAVGARAR